MQQANQIPETNLSDRCRYHTLPLAAKALGIPVSTLRRAVNAGLKKSHTLISSRNRVLLSDVMAAIAAPSVGRA